MRAAYLEYTKGIWDQKHLIKVITYNNENTRKENKILVYVLWDPGYTGEYVVDCYVEELKYIYTKSRYKVNSMEGK